MYKLHSVQPVKVRMRTGDRMQYHALIAEYQRVEAQLVKVGLIDLERKYRCSVYLVLLCSANTEGM